MKDTNNIQHCRVCNQYKPDSDLEEYAGRLTCKSCRQKLEAKRMQKAQRSFEFVGDQETLFGM